MNIDFKNKEGLTFLAIGILMLIIVAVSIMLTIQFVIGNMNKAFDSKVVGGQNEAVKFNIEKAESLLE